MISLLHHPPNSTEPGKNLAAARQEHIQKSFFERLYNCECVQCVREKVGGCEVGGGCWGGKDEDEGRMCEN